MFALALETSGRVGSVALARDGVVIDERTYPHGLQHAAALVPLIDAVCRDHGLAPRDLRELYVSIGPGSFTGLRVGVTLAKTLAFATGARIVAVPSLDVLAENAPAEARDLIVLLDAKRGEVFAARYEREGGAWRVLELARMDRLATVLAAAPRPVTLLGEGVAFHRASIEDASGIIFADESTWIGRASVVARLGRDRASRGAFASPHALVPRYVRLVEAEERRLIAEGKLNADGTPRSS